MRALAVPIAPLNVCRGKPSACVALSSGKNRFVGVCARARSDSVRDAYAPRVCARTHAAEAHLLAVHAHARRARRRRRCRCARMPHEVEGAVAQRGGAVTHRGGAAARRARIRHHRARGRLRTRGRRRVDAAGVAAEFAAHALSARVDAAAAAAAGPPARVDAAVAHRFVAAAVGAPRARAAGADAAAGGGAGARRRAAASLPPPVGKNSKAPFVDLSKSRYTAIESSSF